MLGRLIKKLKSFCWHDWENIYGIWYYTFLGEVVKKEYVAFRICRRCGMAQDVSRDTLSEAEKEILLKKIYEKNGKKDLKGSGGPHAEDL